MSQVWVQESFSKPQNIYTDNKGQTYTYPAYTRPVEEVKRPLMKRM